MQINSGSSSSNKESNKHWPNWLKKRHKSNTSWIQFWWTRLKKKRWSRNLICALRRSNAGKCGFFLLTKFSHKLVRLNCLSGWKIHMRWKMRSQKCATRHWIGRKARRKVWIKSRVPYKWACSMSHDWTSKNSKWVGFSLPLDVWWLWKLKINLPMNWTTKIGNSPIGIGIGTVDNGRRIAGKWHENA